jgi:CheY-like chemotaxis protein
MSRIIRGTIRLEFQQLDVMPVLKAAVEAVRPMMESKNIRLVCALDAGAGLVSGDPSRLQQIFWNLLANAVKFTPPGGRIEVELERAGPQVQIIVRDDGQGISSDFLPYVFERFRQADASMTRRHGGLGLGLSIVKQLVEMHGGSVRAESAGDGKGATFIASLPLAAGKTADVAAPEKAAGALPDRAPVKLDGVKVLVVEDDPDALHLVVRILTESGADVRGAASADEAAAILQSSRPEVLVSDVGMPGKDGYELIHELRDCLPESLRSIPAIALTALARAEDRIRALQGVFVAHLPKPIESRELLVRVATWAGRGGAGGRKVN